MQNPGPALHEAARFHTGGSGGVHSLIAQPPAGPSEKGLGNPGAAQISG